MTDEQNMTTAVAAGLTRSSTRSKRILPDTYGPSQKTNSCCWTSSKGIFACWTLMLLLRGIPGSLCFSVVSFSSLNSAAAAHPHPILVSAFQKVVKGRHSSTRQTFRTRYCSTNQDFGVSRNNNDHKMRVLGVCGGIGSGKSEACRILVSKLGCAAHIDADQVAHGVYAPGSEALNEIIAAFGPSVTITEGESEELDRKKLGSIVFSDPSEMARLERIVWPHVKTLVVEKIAEVQREMTKRSSSSIMSENGGDGVVIVEAAVMLDAGWEDWLDGVWVVRVEPSTAQQRLVSDRGMTLEDALLRMEAQQSRRGIGNLEKEVQNGVVTAIVDNDGSLEDLTNALKTALKDPSSWNHKSPSTATTNES
eukprot:scaffold13078_cov48-Attheya_sp.AAC.2